VRQHNHRGSAWIVIDGVVYDVTAYLRHHPGSEALLLIYAGRDASKAFNFAHSSQQSVRSLLQNMRIGLVPIAGAREVPADAALRTLNSINLLGRLTSCDAIVSGDDLSLRPWRAHIVATSWLGHIKEGIIPLLHASLDRNGASKATETLPLALSNVEATLNHILRLAGARRYNDARRTLQAFTTPFVAWLQQTAAAPFDGTSDVNAMIKHMVEFRAPVGN
jgi:predicted heme/steroid binding protein